MSGVNVLAGAEKYRSKVIPIFESGYYRIGSGVCTVGCKKGKFTIVDSGIGQYGFNGGTYAVDMTSIRTSQWVWVAPEAFADGAALQFEVSCLEGAQDDQLLVRDAEKGSVVNASIAQMSAGVSARAQAVQADGAADARAGWTRGL